jgi:hypothetical protein
LSIHNKGEEAKVDFKKIIYCDWNIIDLAIGFCIFYLWGRSWGKDLRIPKWKASVFVICGALASSVFLMLTYGYHFEVYEDYGAWETGEYVKDFEVDRLERYKYGLKVLFFFLASSLLGYHSGKEKAREVEESYDRLLEKMRSKSVNRDDKKEEKYW